MFRQRRGEVLSSDNCVACMVEGKWRRASRLHSFFTANRAPPIRGLRRERLASSLLLDGLDGIRKQCLWSGEAISSKQLELQG